MRVLGVGCYLRAEKAQSPASDLGWLGPEAGSVPTAECGFGIVRPISFDLLEQSPCIPVLLIRSGWVGLEVGFSLGRKFALSVRLQQGVAVG